MLARKKKKKVYNLNKKHIRIQKYNALKLIDKFIRFQDKDGKMNGKKLGLKLGRNMYLGNQILERVHNF